MDVSGGLFHTISSSFSPLVFYILLERNRKRIRDGEKRDSVSGVKKPLHCPYEFLLTDEEDNQDKCSSGHSRVCRRELFKYN